jgi:F-box interacting protein
MGVVSPDRDSALPIMEALVWRKTPDDVIERILAPLPVEDLLRMRKVCRKWRDILTAPWFRDLHREFAPRQQPWYLASTSKRSFSAYDASTQKWNDLSVPELPGKLPDPDLKVLASSQGLLCFGFRWGELTSTDHLYVCNPITREWRHLAQHPEKTVDHFGMQYDGRTNSYKILTMNVAPSGGTIRRVAIYDSTSDQWTSGHVPNSNVHLSRAPMVWCGERVYFMDRIQPWCELHAYDVEHSTWHELKATSPQVFEYPSLVACNDRLFMVGLRPDGYKIWEVVHRPAGFELVVYDETLSAQLPSEFTEKRSQPVGFGRRSNVNQFRLNAIGSSNLMWFSSNLDHTWVVSYDMDSRSFHQSPKYKHAVHLSAFADLSFQPCLHASP